MKAYVVDSAAVRSNLQQLQTRAGSAVLWAVLKGDGYGLGLLPMAAICREAGVTHFAVTEVSEVSRLRAGGFADASVLMLRPTSEQDELRQLLQLGAILTVSSQNDAAVLNGVAQELGVQAEVHIKIDTGSIRVEVIDIGDVSRRVKLFVGRGFGRRHCHFDHFGRLMRPLWRGKFCGNCIFNRFNEIIGAHIRLINNIFKMCLRINGIRIICEKHNSLLVYKSPLLLHLLIERILFFLNANNLILKIAHYSEVCLVFNRIIELRLNTTCELVKLGVVLHDIGRALYLGMTNIKKMISGVL